MPTTMKKFEEKPYNLCLNCAHIGRKCDGPNFLAMDMPRLSEWCRLRKEYLHGLDPKWTNAYIAEQGGMSKVSVDRFLSGNVADVKVSTASQVLRVLVNGSWGQYPCAMSEWAGAESQMMSDQLAKLLTEKKQLQDNLNIMKEEYRLDSVLLREKAEREMEHLKEAAAVYTEQLHAKDAQIAEKDRQMQERGDFLRRKDRVIQILFVLLVLSWVLILAALIIDLLDPDRGFFWIDQLFNYSYSPGGSILFNATKNILG